MGKAMKTSAKELAAKLVALLTYYVRKGAGKFASEMGEATAEKVKDLLYTIKKQLVLIGDKYSSEILSRYETNPEIYEPVIRKMLEEKLKQDSELAKEIYERLKELASLETIMKSKVSVEVDYLCADEIKGGKVEVAQDLDEIKAESKVTGVRFRKIGKLPPPKRRTAKRGRKRQYRIKSDGDMVSGVTFQGEYIWQRSHPEQRIINTGFASLNEPTRVLDKNLPLIPKKSYYFWFEVGPLVSGTIEVKPEPLKIELLPSEARLKVALFSFKNEIKITPERDVGEIQIMRDSTIKVVRHVERPKDITPDSELYRKRLFFLVKTPNKVGVFRLRCNIYYEQILVESRLIKVRVSRIRKRLKKPALESVVEYSMSKAINPDFLAQMKPQTLSLMLNSNGDGTHCFRLFGKDGYKSETTFNARTLKTLIEHARGNLRRASWGDEDSWNDNKIYRYKGAFNIKQLKKDLIQFAIRGRRFWFKFAQKIVGGKPDADQLSQRMLEPTMLEFVVKDASEAADYMFPASLIYDYPLDTNLNEEDYTLCPSFLEALDSRMPLEDTECFKGNCPSRRENKLSVVCPSGFWGFRHSVGIPLGSASETNHEITYDDAPEITVSAFPSFKKWKSHQAALKLLKQGIIWNFAETRAATFEKLLKTKPHLVYFYCHGGLKRDTPYLKVGTKNDRIITPENFGDYGVFWKIPQPLVFINGCHTAALDPKLMLDFVSSFVISYHAAGVVGTEITVFEELASAFAEECFRRFLIEGEEIGDAVRSTRLKLLKSGNPLGLVYTVYANASLRLKKAN